MCLFLSEYRHDEVMVFTSINPTSLITLYSSSLLRISHSRQCSLCALQASLGDGQCSPIQEVPFLTHSLPIFEWHQSHFHMRSRLAWKSPFTFYNLLLSFSKYPIHILLPMYHSASVPSTLEKFCFQIQRSHLRRDDFYTYRQRYSIPCTCWPEVQAKHENLNKPLNLESPSLCWSWTLSGAFRHFSSIGDKIR